MIYITFYRLYPLIPARGGSGCFQAMPDQSFIIQVTELGHMDFSQFFAILGHAIIPDKVGVIFGHMFGTVIVEPFRIADTIIIFPAPGPDNHCRISLPEAVRFQLKRAHSAADDNGLSGSCTAESTFLTTKYCSIFL